MLITLLFLSDVLWLESTALLFGGAPLMSLLDMKFLTFVFSHLKATCGGHYDVLWLGSTNFLFGGSRLFSLLDRSF